MLAEDKVCNNCGKRWGEHYGKFCNTESAGIFKHNGMYRTPQGVTFKDITDSNPNILFRRKKSNHG